MALVRIARRTRPHEQAIHGILRTRRPYRRHTHSRAALPRQQMDMDRRHTRLLDLCSQYPLADKTSLGHAGIAAQCAEVGKECCARAAAIHPSADVDDESR